MTTHLRRLLPILLILLVGAYFRAVAVHHTDPTNVIEQPLLDDSFYYFTLGRNLAEGKGFLVDDQHPTTGFQPLWGMMSILPALITRDHAGLVFAFQWMGMLVSVIAAVMVYMLTHTILRIAHRQPAQAGLIHLMALCNMALWYWHPHHISYSINGMETVLSTSATLTMLVCFVMLYHHPTWRNIGFFGVSGGIAFLARVDSATLLIWLILALLLFPPLRGGVIHRLKQVVVAGVIGLLVISPWALITFSQGKFILPESGLAVRAHTLYTGQPDQLPPRLSIQSALAGDEVFATYYGKKVAHFMEQISEQIYALNNFFTTPNEIALENINFHIVNINISQSVLIMLIGIVAIGGVSITTGSKLMRGLWLISGLWLITSIVMYSFIIISWWFYERYALPPAEIITIIALCIIYGLFLRFASKKWVIVFIILIINSLMLIGNWQMFTMRYAWIGAYLPVFNTHIQNSPAPRSGFYETAVWLNQNVPSTTKVGVFQSGIIVYYADATIINLDGKVNANAHHAMTKSYMWDYICEEQIDYIVDWPAMIYFLLMQRSTDWHEDNLEQIILIEGIINPIQVNRVNMAQCSS